MLCPSSGAARVRGLSQAETGRLGGGPTLAADSEGPHPPPPSLCHTSRSHTNGPIRPQDRVRGPRQAGRPDPEAKALRTSPPHVTASTGQPDGPKARTGAGSEVASSSETKGKQEAATAPHTAAGTAQSSQRNRSRGPAPAAGWSCPRGPSATQGHPWCAPGTVCGGATEAARPPPQCSGRPCQRTMRPDTRCRRRDLGLV